LRLRHNTGNMGNIAAPTNATPAFPLPQRRLEVRRRRTGDLLALAGDVGRRVRCTVTEHQPDAAVLELSLDQDGLAATRMEPIIDPPFRQMFVGSMSPF
jgi:hypothetical protein